MMSAETGILDLNLQYRLAGFGKLFFNQHTVINSFVLVNWDVYEIFWKLINCPKQALCAKSRMRHRNNHSQIKLSTPSE